MNNIRKVGEKNNDGAKYGTQGVTNKLNQLVSFSCIKLKRYTKGMSLFRVMNTMKKETNDRNGGKIC